MQSWCKKHQLVRCLTYSFCSKHDLSVVMKCCVPARMFLMIKTPGRLIYSAQCTSIQLKGLGLQHFAGTSVAFAAAERASEVWEMREMILFIVLTQQSVCMIAGWAGRRHSSLLQACLNSHGVAIQPSSLGFWGAAETERAGRGRTDPIPSMSQPSHAMFSSFLSRQCYCSSLPYCS